jgi:uncharacterized protein (DUF3084 family)
MGFPPAWTALIFGGGMHEDDDPPPTEVRQGVEEFLGKPAKVAPEQGIANATQDIAYLTEQRASVETAIKNHALNLRQLEEELLRLDRELASARQLLASYQNQLKSRN